MSSKLDFEVGKILTGIRKRKIAAANARFDALLTNGLREGVEGMRANPPLNERSERSEEKRQMHGSTEKSTKRKSINKKIPID